MTRITEKFLQTRLERIAVDMGWQMEGRAAGAVYLDNNPIYGGYELRQYANEHGGIRVLNGSRMSPAAMLAWLQGAEFVADSLRKA